MLYRDFWPWEKLQQHTWKNIVFFTCVDLANQLLNSLAFGATRSGWWMNGKVFTILNTSCLSELSWIRAAKTLKKIRIADRQWGSNFPRRGKKTNILKENYDHCCFCYHDSTHFSILGVSANALCDCHSGFVDSYFHSLCLYDKQNNTWLLSS